MASNACSWENEGAPEVVEHDRGEPPIHVERNTVTSNNRTRKKPKPSLVYFAQVGDFVKIGTTRNSVPVRLNAITKGLVISPAGTRGSNPRLLGVMLGDAKAERAIHARFAAFHVTGEWVSISDELRAFIAAKCDPDLVTNEYFRRYLLVGAGQ